jgi:hypothetical protein
MLNVQFRSSREETCKSNKIWMWVFDIMREFADEAGSTAV